MSKFLLLSFYTLFLSAAIILFTPLMGFQSIGKEDSSGNSFVQLKKEFISPDKQYGSAPLWVWHTKVTETIIDSMMQEFKKNAFGGVFVHPRPGLITEYLSQEWFDLFQYTVKKGKELGLDVWIYDENSYPTGFAGGLVQDQMPESVNQGQMLHMTTVSVLPAVMNDIFICLKEIKGNFVDITSTMNSERGRQGKYYLFTKEFYTANRWILNGPIGFSYVDLMVKGVTEKFIGVTMKGYEKVAGAEFGKTVPGIFSDEPSIPIEGEGNVRWTPDLFNAFKEKWGYDLEKNLPSLFEEVGDWKKVRHNYHEVLLQLFIDRWSKPFYNYAEKNNLIWTGHYWEHEWPDPQNVPDNMAMYAWPQQPGIDMLFNQFDEKSTNAQFGNIRAVKELASVGNQLDKKRKLSESYGGAGWELTFKDMKRLGDWEYVLGVNFLTQHLSMMTLTGSRKYDYPQSFSYHNSCWPYYGVLNKYFARLSLAMSQGRQQNNILIIEPTTSAWMYSCYGKSNKRRTEIGDSFQAFVAELEKAQVEYDLGSENVIKDHGKVENGKFVVGQRAYTTIVIPPGMENIDLPTFNLLKEYAAKGGRVLGFEKFKMLDGALKSELQYFNTSKENIFQFSALDKIVISQYFQSPDFKISGNGSDPIGGDLYHQRRLLDDGELVFLSNASMESPANGHLKMKGKDALLMDLFTGEIVDYPEQEQEGGVKVDFNIPPAGSMLLFISDKKQSGFSPYQLAKNKTEVKSGVTEVMRPSENTLMIDFCDVKINNDDTPFNEIHTYKANNMVYQKFGFKEGDGDPWNNQTQFRNRIVERDTFPTGTGFAATYHFTINKGVNYKKIRAVVEQGGLWNKILINGKEIQPSKNKWWLDRSFGVLEVGNYLREGDNTLSVSVEPMNVYAEIEPIYILGNFDLESADKGWNIAPPKPLQLGSWKNQGLPMYGHGITYVKEIKLENIDKQFEVRLGKWNGTVAAVKVNGKSAGIIMADPNTLNITSYLKKGANRIEIEVVGSLKNLLGPHHTPYKPGYVGPGHWENVTTYQPGNKYETFDYGLMEDFQLIEY